MSDRRRSHRPAPPTEPPPSDIQPPLPPTRTSDQDAYRYINEALDGFDLGEAMRRTREHMDAVYAERDSLKAEVERLNRHRDELDATKYRLLKEVRALDEQVERLRELVHEAYIDGFLQHSVDFHYQAVPPNAELAWEVSDARAALERERDNSA